MNSTEKEPDFEVKVFKQRCFYYKDSHGAKIEVLASLVTCDDDPKFGLTLNFLKRGKTIDIPADITVHKEHEGNMFELVEPWPRDASGKSVYMFIVDKTFHVSVRHRGAFVIGIPRGYRTVEFLWQELPPAAS